MMTMAMLGAVLIVLVSTAQWDVLQLLHIILNLHPDSLTTMMTFIRAIVYVTCVSVLIYGMYAVWVFRQGRLHSLANVYVADQNSLRATVNCRILIGMYLQRMPRRLYSLSQAYIFKLMYVIAFNFRKFIKICQFRSKQSESL